jgi:hypothetical protein
MKKEIQVPFWGHLIGIAGAFFGWIGVSYFLDQPMTREKFAESVFEACIFTFMIAIVDGVAWCIRKSGHQEPYP